MIHTRVQFLECVSNSRTHSRARRLWQDDDGGVGAAQGTLGPRAKLFTHNDPATWLRVSGAAKSDAYGQGYEEDGQESEQPSQVWGGQASRASDGGILFPDLFSETS